jgi:DNA replication ATP-dependent helicase Dna2
MQATALRSSSSFGLELSYEFRRHPCSTHPLSCRDTQLAPGDTVVISSDDGLRLAIAIGVLLAVEHDLVVVSTSSPLRVGLSSASTVFSASQECLPSVPLRIDRDVVNVEPRAARGVLASLFTEDAASGTAPRARCLPICGLMEKALRTRRRSCCSCVCNFDWFVLIGMLILPATELLETSHLPLNEDQRRAVSHVLSCRDYALILGMPGTGKTTLIASLIRILVRMGMTVLVCAFTHSAVDNILSKIMVIIVQILLMVQESPTIPFVRLGKKERIRADVWPYSISALTSAASSVTSVGDVLRGRPVVAATCLGVHGSLLANRIFDVCIIDEASQCTQVPT